MISKLKEETKVNNSGITLIALVITIIVLLILTGVSIGAIVGDNGIISQAISSKSKTEEASIKEQMELAWAARMSKYYEDLSKGNTTEENIIAYFTREALNEQLKIGTIKNNIQRNSKTGKFDIIYENEDGTVFQLEATLDGEVEIVKTLSERDITTARANEIIEEYVSELPEREYENKKDLYGVRIETGISEINGVEVYDNWKVFYIDENNVYLIYGDYFPNAALSITSEIKRHNDFDIYAMQNRDSLINYLKDPNNFETISNTLKGVGKTFNGKTSLQVTGSPTLEMWIESWNEKYEDNLGYYNITGEDITSEKEFNQYNNREKIVAKIQGMIMTRNKNEAPTEYEYNLPYNFMKQKEGYKEGYNPEEDDETDDRYTDNLYYPRKHSYNGYCHGYWLASPSAVPRPNNNDAQYVCAAGSLGAVCGIQYFVCNYSTRPVISIAKPEFQEATGIKMN